MDNFLKGLENHNNTPVIDFTPKYRVYYDISGEVLSVIATEYNKEPPEGDYILITADEFRTIKLTARVQNGKLVHPSAETKFYNLVRSDTGYGTKKNNPYIVGDQEFYEYERKYE